jgi:hypothetical protein
MNSPWLTWIVSGFFLALFLLLVLGVAWLPDALSNVSPVRLTWGQLLVILIHVLSVAAAWAYIGMRDNE